VGGPTSLQIDPEDAHLQGYEREEERGFNVWWAKEGQTEEDTIRIEKKSKTRVY